MAWDKQIERGRSDDLVRKDSGELRSQETMVLGGAGCGRIREAAVCEHPWQRRPELGVGQTDRTRERRERCCRTAEDAGEEEDRDRGVRMEEDADGEGRGGAGRRPEKGGMGPAERLRRPGRCKLGRFTGFDADIEEGIEEIAPYIQHTTCRRPGGGLNEGRADEGDTVQDLSLGICRMSICSCKWMRVMRVCDATELRSNS